MPLSLHAAVIPGWLQTLGAVEGLIDKAEAWSSETGHDERELLEARLAEDMLPLAYQFKSCRTHSRRALDSTKTGAFSPDMSPYPDNFGGCREKIAEAIAACEAVDEEELESRAGNDLVFSIGDRLRLDFAVRDFLLSFSTPNLYFHAATAYGILRMKGMPIGKRDFMGAMRLKA